jgi:type VI secretion system secreted protein Hcp
MPIYLKYSNPTVNGGVTTDSFTNQIEVFSLQWGVGRAVSSTTGKAGNREGSTPSVSELTVSKEFDNASGGLLKEALGAGTKATLVFSFVRTDGGGAKTYLECTLTDTIITGFSMSSGGDKPTESLSFNFTKVEWKFTPTKPDGTDGSPFPVTYDLGLQKLT